MFSDSGMALPWVAFMPGDLGPIWTSGKGGGLGRRGELDGDMLPIEGADGAMIVRPAGCLRN